MKRLLFIYNPYAGKGMIRNSLSYILEEFSACGYEVVVHPTSGVKDAARCVEECGDSFDLIVCSGGDGTLDEVVTGMQTGRFMRPIGYIPDRFDQRLRVQSRDSEADPPCCQRGHARIRISL